MERMTRYYEVKNGGDMTHLKAEVYYNIGGMALNGRYEKRGYYMSVSPVRREDIGNGYISERYVAYTGLKMLVVECGRKSQKKMNEAMEYFDTNILDFIYSRFTGYEIDTDNYETIAR